MQNANGKNSDELIGCEVDFLSKDGKASEIYITKETKTLGKNRLKSTLQSVDSALINFDANKAKSKIKSAFGGADTGLTRIQKRTYVMVACFVASSVLPFGFVFKVVAFVFGILATKELCKLTHRALMKKFIVLFVLVWVICMAPPFGSSNVQIIGNYGRGIPSLTGMFSVGMSNAFLLGVAGLEQALRIIAIILIIPTFFILRAYTRELVSITQQRYFNFVLYFGTVGLLPLPFVSTILSLIALGFYVVAWAKTTELIKTHTDEK